jgi:hypothetical protein
MVQYVGVKRSRVSWDCHERVIIVPAPISDDASAKRGRRPRSSEFGVLEVGKSGVHFERVLLLTSYKRNRQCRRAQAL